MVFTYNHGFLGYGEECRKIEEKKKPDGRKTLKSEEKEKGGIRGKPNNNNI